MRAGLPLVAATLLLAAPAHASKEKVFFAKAVTYCSAARAIVVDKFLLEYNAEENSISFDISAATVEQNLDAELMFTLQAYGTISLCDTLGGVLCPLPTYDFVGSATIPLPTSVSSHIKIPGIGYVIPDLEATAYVRLLRVSNGEEAACLRVDLSNGRTTRHDYVSWALGGIAILSLVVGIAGGAVNLWKGGPGSVDQGRRKERLVSILIFYQFVTTTGLLSLNYPLVFTSYVANFAWTVGLQYVESIQVSIDHTRQRTGGNLTQLAGNLVGGTEALSSRENYVVPEVDVKALASNLARRFATPASHGVRLAKRAAETAVKAIAIPNVQETNSLDSVEPGIPRFATNEGISPFNVYLTALITFLLLFAVFIAFLILFAPPFFLLERRARKRETQSPVSRHTALHLVRANALRVLLVSWFPLLIFAFFQWTIGHHDSYAPIVLSAFTTVFTTGALIYLALRTVALLRRNGHDQSQILAAGGAPYAPFWNGFKSRHWWFFLPLLLATFLRSMFIAFARNHGWRQTIGLLVIESMVFIAMVVFRPFEDKSSNWTNITVQVLRVIISGALIVFNQSLELNEIIRVAIGIVIAVIESVVVLGYFILVLVDAVAVIVRAVRRRRPANAAATAPDMLQIDTSTPSSSNDPSPQLGTARSSMTYNDSPVLKHSQFSPTTGVSGSRRKPLYGFV